MDCYLRHHAVLIIFLALLNLHILKPTSSLADIYKYVDEDGTVCFTDSPPKDKRAVKIISEKRGSYTTKRGPTKNAVTSPIRKVSGRQYEDLVHRFAEQYYIDPNLIKAVITAESNWDPFAVSKKGAMGLMQLMPHTASALNVRNPYDPEENIRAGIRYLKYLLDKFNGDLILAIAAYNAGPSVVERFGSVPPISETLQYVKKVLSMSGYSTRKLNLKELKKKKEEIYMIRLADGSILYTNSGLTR